MAPLNLTIEGMHCGGCVNRVTTTLKGITGVKVEQVDVGSARLSYDPAQTSPQAVSAALANAGYRVTSAPSAAGR